MTYIGDDWYDQRLDKVATELGGEVVGMIELSPPNYSFDLLAVIKTDKGLYISTDSGCSCPSPFESHSAGDFTGPLTSEQAAEEYESIARQSYGPMGNDYINEKSKQIKEIA